MGDSLVVILLKLDLQLHVQSVPITNKVVSSNLTQCNKVCQLLATDLDR
jgi:hypothetical protein